MAEVQVIPTAPINGSNESQQIASSGGTLTSGRLKLAFRYNVTDWLNWNATATEVRDALRALNHITANGVSSATGGPLNTTPIVCNFGGHLAGSDIPQLTVAANELVGGTVAITTTAAGVNASPRGLPKGAIVVAADTGIAYINNGTPEAPVWNRIAAGASAALANLVHSVGTADGTLDDVGGAFSQTILNNNFRELSNRVNALAQAMRNAGTLLP